MDSVVLLLSLAACSCVAPHHFVLGAAIIFKIIHHEHLRLRGVSQECDIISAGSAAIWQDLKRISLPAALQSQVSAATRRAWVRSPEIYKTNFFIIYINLRALKMLIMSKHSDVRYVASPLLVFSDLVCSSTMQCLHMPIRCPRINLIIKTIIQRAFMVSKTTTWRRTPRTARPHFIQTHKHHKHQAPHASKLLRWVKLRHHCLSLHLISGIYLLSAVVVDESTHHKKFKTPNTLPTCTNQRLRTEKNNMNSQPPQPLEQFSSTYNTNEHSERNNLGYWSLNEK